MKNLNHKGTTALSYTKTFFVLLCVLCVSVVNSQKAASFSQLEKDFLHPPQSAKPWVFWYWLHGAVSKEGITADLEAMKEVGLGGAYLMFIKDTNSAKVAYQPQASQLSKEWFAMVSFAIQEAKRLNIQLGFHVSDGFALAGGPWITPELSMQKIVSSKTYISSGYNNTQLLRPITKEDYYKDISIVAYPTKTTLPFYLDTDQIRVTSSLGDVSQSLPYLNENKTEIFKSDTACWIQYSYPASFVFRSATIYSNNNYQALRLIVQASEDGINFNTITQFIPPRHGWQDADEPYTFSLPPTKARFVRFVFDKTGSEPGAEGLDAAKWKSTLKIKHIFLSDDAVIDNYQAKNGSVWRVAAPINTLNNIDAIPLKNILNLTGKIDKNGMLQYTLPKGNWTIVRIGVTTTGHKNETAGGGKGLECDKFNPVAVKLQFDNWFNKIYHSVDTTTAKEVIKLFHVDSWECGSQNWSSSFPTEFKKRRGYDLLPYLPVMAGIPIESIAKSEQVLHDVRQTIAELVNDIFYGTLKQLVQQKGLAFSAESVAPTMLSDGMLHYKNVTMPMGEFWNNSPTHDKPNDMLDAISAAHVYGKQIVQAEAFTTLRMNWNEHPGNLKPLGDRNFALGINKMVLHVMMHNPWMNKQPGVTLDPIGLYYQRNQTWFKQSKVWIDYMTRCQAILQQGKPVVDVAVFTGEELPRRSVLPDALVNTLPGIFAKERVEAEQKRLQNTNQPLRKIPAEVTHSANMYDANDWVNPLNGYNYDSFNPDVLMSMKVIDGKVVTQGGAMYKILLIPAHTAMNPINRISNGSIKKIIELVKAGATVLIDSIYQKQFVQSGATFNFRVEKNIIASTFGKGKFVLTPFVAESFETLGLPKDVKLLNHKADYKKLAFTHRKINEADVYFLSNQSSKQETFTLAFRTKNKLPEYWHTIQPSVTKLRDWYVKDSSTVVTIELFPYQTTFIVFRDSTQLLKGEGGHSVNAVPNNAVWTSDWQLQFDTAYGGLSKPLLAKDLKDWTSYTDTSIKYYSGTVIYKNSFTLENTNWVMLSFSKIENIATIKVNGIDCGTIFTYPYYTNISKAVKKGLNTIEIAVTNTWNNRLILDSQLPPEKRVTYTAYPFDWSKKSLQSAGIIGEVKIVSY